MASSLRPDAEGAGALTEASPPRFCGTTLLRMELSLDTRGAGAGTGMMDMPVPPPVPPAKAGILVSRALKDASAVALLLPKPLLPSILACLQLCLLDLLAICMPNNEAGT